MHQTMLSAPFGVYLPLRGCQGFPGGSDSKESACNVGDPGLIPRSGEGNGYPLQYSFFFLLLHEAILYSSY